MKTTLVILLLAFLGPFAWSQNALKEYAPINIYKPDLSAKADAAIRRQTALLEKPQLTAAEQKELDVLLEKYGEVVGGVWNVIEGGCSWYCGGGNYKVVASSTQKGTKGIAYSAENANDLSYQTAWVAGGANAGKGEYLAYYFKNTSPRITTIIISNGYLKTQTAWKENNRLKKLKLSVNGKPFGILNLEDSRSDQFFELGTFGHNADGTDLILKFEIVAVYKGAKYDDTAITEIYFNGIDVH